MGGLSLRRIVIYQARRVWKQNPGITWQSTMTPRKRALSSVSEMVSPPSPGTCTKYGEYPGGILPYTSELEILDPEKMPVWPVYRVLETDGTVRNGAEEPDLDAEFVLKMYGTIARLQTMDHIFYEAQRQGRISFYLQSAGEEALQIGSAAALDKEDVVFMQYREPGILMWRGFDLQNFADQCFGNKSDLGKGRQMPVHYGSAELHCQTVSSPLGTQIPQAVGAGYALKLAGKANISVCYFGDGAASMGDFHAALLMAATRDVPVVFICRNNGYAISTPVKEQYRGDGVVSRAPGYGIQGIRVDGNDALAMYQAVSSARQLSLERSAPVLVEAMTYRVGHHSTSDDWSRYRSSIEVKQWTSKDNPAKRLRLHLEGKGLWDMERDRSLRDMERVSVLKVVEIAERKTWPALSTMFEDVYHDMPPHLREQREHLKAHLSRHPGIYEIKED